MAVNYDLNNTGPEVQSRLDQVFPNKSDIDALGVRVDGHDADIAELNNEIDALEKQDVIPVDTLPTVAESDPKAIYRVAGEDSYTDYMVNASGDGWKELAEFSFPGIDEEPTAGSGNLVKSGGVSKAIGDASIKAALPLYKTGADYKLQSTGAGASDEDYDLMKYEVSEGELLRVVLSKDSDGVCQFQETEGVYGTVSSNNIVGSTFTTALNGILIVPADANYLIVSQAKTNTTNKIYRLSEYEDTPTANSTNVVGSNGLYRAIINQQYNLTLYDAYIFVHSISLHVTSTTSGNRIGTLKNAKANGAGFENKDVYLDSSFNVNNDRCTIYVPQNYVLYIDDDYTLKMSSQGSASFADLSKNKIVIARYGNYMLGFGVTVEHIDIHTNTSDVFIASDVEEPSNIEADKFVDGDGNVIDSDNTSVITYDVTDSTDVLAITTLVASSQTGWLVNYFNEDGDFLGHDVYGWSYYREKGSLTHRILNMPLDTTVIKINKYTTDIIIESGSKKCVLPDDVQDANESLSELIKLERDGFVSILDERRVVWINGEYINDEEVIAQNFKTRRSIPISVKSGDYIIVVDNGRDISKISLTDNDGTSFTNVGDTTEAGRCTYLVNEDGYVCISGRYNLSLQIIRSNPVTSLYNTKEIQGTLYESKWVGNDGVVIDSTSGNWNVIEYDVSDKEYLMFYAEEGARNTGYLLFYYDENDNLLQKDYKGSYTSATIANNLITIVPPAATKALVNWRVNKPEPIMANIYADINVSSGNGDTSALPKYYNDYLASRVSSINEAYLFSNARSSAFIFATDIHYPNANKYLGRVIAEVVSNTPINTAICGGDICGPTIKKGDETTSLESVNASLQRFMEDMSYIQKCGIPVFKAKGNHDFSIAKQEDDDSYTGFWIDWVASRNIILGNEANGIVTNTNDEKCCYYYKDYPNEKLRYIYFDTTDSNSHYPANNSISPKISNDQMLWIINSAVLTTPQDYNLVIISHIYFQYILGTQDSYANYENFANVRTLLAAIQNKTTATILNVNYDFSEFSPNIIMNISGHNHRDCAVFNEGFWSFTVGGNFTTNELRRSPIYERFPYLIKTTYDGIGTVYENLSEVVIANGLSKIDTFRIGAGFDKTFNQTCENVSVGQTLQLVSALETEDIEWWCHDSTGRSYEDGHMIYYNNFAEIDEYGLVTAKAAGYVTAVAVSRSLNKAEFFGIKVV